MPPGRTLRALKCTASTPVAASCRTFEGLTPLPAISSMRPAACATNARSAPRGQDPAASGSHRRFERLLQVARHVERPVEGGLHRPRLGDQGSRTLHVDPPVGGEHAEDHAVGATFAGEAHLFEHLAEFGIGIEEIPAAGTHHRAALVRGGTQFHARDTRTAGSLARLDAVGAKFGRHTAKVKNPHRKNKPAKRPAAAAEKGTGNPDRHMAHGVLPAPGAGGQRSTTVTDIGPWAPNTSACSMSAVFEGPDMKHP